MEHPKLRYGLEVLPFVEGDTRKLVVRDRLGYSEKTLVIGTELLDLLTGMDGTNSLRDLQALFMRQTGQLLYSEQLQQVLDTLDEALFLENERFIGFVARQVSVFQKDPVRRMQLAGRSYPAKADALTEEIMGFFDPAMDGPGPVSGRREDRSVLGLMAPHIDIKAGGACFAHAYKAALEARVPETWVVLATGHEPVRNSFALTLKDFETPHGLVECDRTFGHRLAEGCPRDLFSSEYNHHREHSVEFQAVFLSCLLPGARIVPVLCSFSHDEPDSERAYIDEFCVLLRKLMDESDYPVGLLASVDLAHIGPRYGDPSSPSPALVNHHMKEDERLLQQLSICDASAFMARIRKERNERRICGVPPLFVLAKVLEGRAEGKLLQHAHAQVDQQASFVSFASMVFYDVS